MVGEVCAPEEVEPALVSQRDANNLLRYPHPQEPSWGRVKGTRKPGLEQGKLGSDGHGGSIGTQIGVPIGIQDGVRIRALPLGVAPVTPLDGARLLLLELLSVFPEDLHCMVLGHSGLGVLCALEESQLQGHQGRP